MNNKLKIVSFFFLLLFLQCTILSQTKTGGNQPEAVTAAYGVLNRTVPQEAKNFRLMLIENNKANDEFEVEASNGIVTVKGNSSIALTRGIYYYLRHADNSMITWNGSHRNLPKVLPDYPRTKIVTPYKYRLYYNVCTFGYTTAFWNWEQWQKEIDWMALHGINMPLAMIGQEAVWQKVWKEMGIKDSELADYFTGPAFLPWHRMGNVNKHGGPLPKSYFKKSEELQKKILTRMRELGMNPIVPAFSGYVPNAFKRIYPDANIITMKPWAGFPPSNGTFMLSPLSKHFVQIGKKFIQEYQKIYGRNHFYLADAFNEMTVPVTKKGRYKELAAFGKAIFNSINAGDSKGIWVMQGWLFFNDSGFWDKPSVKALLKDVPDKRMIIIDLADELFHGWKKLDGFFGKQWIYSIIHNFGGHNQWFGNLPLYSKDPINMLSDTAHGNLLGFGVSPEGIDNNEVVYELLTDMAWQNKSLDLNNWIAQYCMARYGAYPSAMKEAWVYLIKSVYSTGNNFPLYFYQERPRSAEYHGWLSSNNFDKAAELFLSCSDSLKESDLYNADAIQIAAQFVSNKVDFLLNRAIYWYGKRNKAQMKNAFNSAFVLLKKVDELLNNHPLYRLQRWVRLARSWGTSPQEKDFYESNAKRQITTWGGPYLSEYAAKEWGGLIKDYYLQRWKRFADSLETGTNYNIYSWEEKWITTPVKGLSNKKLNDSIEYAKQLISKSIKDCNKFSEQVTIKLTRNQHDEEICSLEPKKSGLKIYYTMDGSEPSINSNFYSKPFNVELPVEIKAVTYKDNKKFGDLIYRTYSLSYGASVKLITNVSPKYKDKSAVLLTDGVNGSLNFNDGKWLGFEGNDFGAIIDLGKNTSVREISTGFLQNIGSWIFLPDSITYSVSSNGKDFHMVSVLKNSISEKKEGAFTKSFDAKLKDTKARYIKVYAKSIGNCPPWHSAAGKKAWLFVDEVSVN